MINFELTASCLENTCCFTKPSVFAIKYTLVVVHSRISDIFTLTWPYIRSMRSPSLSPCVDVYPQHRAAESLCTHVYIIKYTNHSILDTAIFSQQTTHFPSKVTVVLQLALFGRNAKHTLTHSHTRARACWTPPNYHNCDSSTHQSICGWYL